ncbi:DUF3644 domain-containing protein [Candidatus Hepatincola sp. Pdp]
MVKKVRNPITDYEISIIKRLLQDGVDKQDIQFKIDLYRYFINNNKSLNFGRINDIENLSKNLGVRSSKVEPANDVIISNFKNIISNGNLTTRLNPFIDSHELIIKAREFMVAAINSFNSSAFNSCTEQFLIFSNIAWTSLLQTIAIDKSVEIICNEKYLSLKKLIIKLHNINALTSAMKINLELLIKIRDQVVHTPHHKFPTEIFSYLQASCFNFNKVIISYYGEERGLDNTFSIALQMATFKPFQLQSLGGKNSNNNFAYIESTINDFEKELDNKVLENQEYKCNIAIVPLAVNKENKADFVCVIPPDSKEAKDIQNIVFKSKIVIDKQKNYPYFFKKIVELLKKENYKITTYSLSQKIKEFKIKDKENYAYQHNSDKRFTYSEEFIIFLRKELDKVSTP